MIDPPPDRIAIGTSEMCVGCPTTSTMVPGSSVPTLGIL